MSVLQSFPTPGTLEGIRSSPFTFRQRRPVLSKQRFVGFGNFLEFFLRPLRVVLQDRDHKDQGAPKNFNLLFTWIDQTAIPYLDDTWVQVSEKLASPRLLLARRGVQEPWHNPSQSASPCLCYLDWEIYDKDDQLVLPILPPHVAPNWQFCWPQHNTQAFRDPRQTHGLLPDNLFVSFTTQ